MTSRPTGVRRFLLTAATAAIAVTVTSCGSSTPSTGLPADRTGSASPSASPPPGAPPNPRPSSYSVSEDGRTITVEFGVGVCPPATYGADATETDRRVVLVVSARTWQTQAPGTACIELAKIERASVTLESPLGQRAVVDQDGTVVVRH